MSKMKYVLRVVHCFNDAINNTIEISGKVASVAVTIALMPAVIVGNVIEAGLEMIEDRDKEKEQLNNEIKEKTKELEELRKEIEERQNM